MYGAVVLQCFVWLRDCSGESPCFVREGSCLLLILWIFYSTPPYPLFRDQAWDLEGFRGISRPRAPNSIFTRYLFLHINFLRYIIIIV